jgi:hypothetical protein
MSSSVLKSYIASSIFYNVQILPDILLCATVLLAVLLANQSVMLLAIAAIGNQLLVSTVGRLMLRYSPDNAVIRSSMDMCTGGYIGKSWARLLGMEDNDLWSPLAPSLYMSALGFFGGWGGALSQLYKEEIDAGIVSRTTVIACGAIMLFVVLLAAIVRASSGCESFVSIAGGLALGGLMGYFLAIALGFSTDRRATNLWGIPLLRDRINAGAAVYICNP